MCARWARWYNSENTTADATMNSSNGYHPHHPSNDIFLFSSPSTTLKNKRQKASKRGVFKVLVLYYHASSKGLLFLRGCTGVARRRSTAQLVIRDRPADNAQWSARALGASCAKGCSDFFGGTSSNLARVQQRSAESALSIAKSRTHCALRPSAGRGACRGPESLCRQLPARSQASLASPVKSNFCARWTS